MNLGLNKVLVIGWLDGDPEVRRSPNGRSVASLTVSTSRSWENEIGEVQTQTEWFNVVAWGRLADVCQSLRGGDRVYLEGRLQTRSWQDSEGRKHFRTEVFVHELIPLTD